MAVFNAVFALAVVLLLIVGVGWWLLRLMDCLMPRAKSATDAVQLQVTGTVRIETHTEPPPPADPVLPIGGPYPTGRRID